MQYSPSLSEVAVSVTVDLVFVLRGRHVGGGEGVRASHWHFGSSEGQLHVMIGSYGIIVVVAMGATVKEEGRDAPGPGSRTG